jgi:NADPH-dependent 2,4-dienoyl-CoA reductase/sulfur reductase-like enzyme
MVATHPRQGLPTNSIAIGSYLPYRSEDARCGGGCRLWLCELYDNLLSDPSCAAEKLSPASPIHIATTIMADEHFAEVQGGGSLILAWQVRNKRVLVVGGGEAGFYARLDDDY